MRKYHQISNREIISLSNWSNLNENNLLKSTNQWHLTLLSERWYYHPENSIWKEKKRKKICIINEKMETAMRFFLSFRSIWWYPNATSSQHSKNYAFYRFYCFLYWINIYAMTDTRLWSRVYIDGFCNKFLLSSTVPFFLNFIQIAIVFDLNLLDFYIPTIFEISNLFLQYYLVSIFNRKTALYLGMLI